MWILHNAKIKDLSYYRKVNQLDESEIMWRHIEMCIERNMIEGISTTKTLGDDRYSQSHDEKITPLGYEFLSYIKENEVLEKLKSFNFKDLSLDQVFEFGKKVSSNFIAKKLGIED